MFYGWPPDAQFLVPDEVKAYMGKAVERGAQGEKDWDGRYNAWATEFPDLAKTCQQMLNQELPDGWDKDIPSFPADAKELATRESGSATRSGRRTGTVVTTRGRRSSLISRRLASRCSIKNCPMAGTRTFHRSLPMPKAWPHESRGARC